MNKLNLNNYLDNFSFTSDELITKFNFTQSEYDRYRILRFTTIKGNVKFFNKDFLAYFNYKENVLINIHLFYKTEDIPKDMLPEDYYEKYESYSGIGASAYRQKVHVNYFKHFLIEKLGNNYEIINLYEFNSNGYEYVWNKFNNKIKVVDAWTPHDGYPNGGYISIEFA